MKLSLLFVLWFVFIFSGISYASTNYQDSQSVGNQLWIQSPDGQTQNPLVIINSTNDFNQVFVQNLNNGTHASTDIIIGNDQSSPTSTSNFFDLSLNSSGYTDNVFGGKSDMGAFTSPGITNFILGVQQTNGILHLRVGGATSANDVLNLTSNSISAQGGALISGNGGGLTNLNGSNITGGTTNGFTVIFTNLALNTIYTNTFSTPILVSGITPVFTTALVAGRCTMNFSITNSGVATNITPSQVTVGLIGSATGTMTNTSISFMITNGGTFAITDASSGAGNSVSIAGNPSFSYVQQIAIANSFAGNGIGLTNVYAGAYKPQGGTPTIVTNLPGLGAGGSAVIVSSGNDVPADNNSNFILTSTASSTANAKVATITFGITLPQTPKRMILTFNGSSVTTEYQAMSLYATNLTTSGAEIWASAQALGSGAYHGNWDIKY